MKVEQIKQLMQDAQAWVDSDKGIKALEKAVEDAKKTAVELEEARRINPDDLHRHFTL